MVEQILTHTIDLQFQTRVFQDFPVELPKTPGILDSGFASAQTSFPASSWGSCPREPRWPSALAEEIFRIWKVFFRQHSRQSCKLFGTYFGSFGWYWSNLSLLTVQIYIADAVGPMAKWVDGNIWRLNWKMLLSLYEYQCLCSGSNWKKSGKIVLSQSLSLTTFP